VPDLGQEEAPLGSGSVGAAWRGPVRLGVSWWRGWAGVLGGLAR
jgi:hypothetical protein